MRAKRASSLLDDGLELRTVPMDRGSSDEKELFNPPVWVGWVRSSRERWRAVAEGDDYDAVWRQLLAIEAPRSIDRLVVRRSIDPNSTRRRA
jgi:hypothetical protein